MKIVNKTNYETKRLRSIICTVHNHVAKMEGRLSQWKNLTIEFDYCKKRKEYPLGKFRANGNGLAWYQNILIRLPEYFTFTFILADLIAHELLHLYGYSHLVMGVGERLYTVAGCYKSQSIVEKVHPCLVIKDSLI